MDQRNSLSEAAEPLAVVASKMPAKPVVVFRKTLATDTSQALPV
jgi:hypothetical protein